MSKQENHDEGGKQGSGASNKVSYGSLIMSTLAAAVGVQNDKNLEKDFATSSPFPYIVAGIVFTVIFLACLIFIAKIALAE
ncbi:DUF2970 domain-containing protein [Agarilytica rhodophyticola]|uniref:DUF2970 domain-containing protein n=1 Tax=Agarilytica rhodophyticola TaxID=1737490 RepID=UPI000B34880B|nr:DUF2970 domain-containing protein [Agarilytica rhodophyticola]